MGSLDSKECIAKNVEFRSNEIKGAKFDLLATDQDHSYSVYWTLNVKVSDAKKSPVKYTEITIRDKGNAIVLQGKTDENGKLQTELPEYAVNGKEKNYSSPYTISVGDYEKKVELNKNMEIDCVIK